MTHGMKQFHLSIVTPEKEAFAEEVLSVSVPSEDGRLMILPHHARLFAALAEGEVKIIQQGKESLLAIGGGFIDVGNNSATILVSEAVHAHELNEEAIVRAKKSAEELLAKAQTEADRAAALSLLRRSTIEDRLLSRIRRRAHA